MNVRTIQVEEYPAAAALMFAQHSPEEREHRVATLMQLVADGVCTPAGWYVAEENNTVCGTLLTQLLPTRTAIVTLPHGAVETFAALVELMIGELRDNSFLQATLFLDATDHDSPALPFFATHGFQFVTNLQSLHRLVESDAEPDLKTFRIEPFLEGDDQLFGERILATYQDSLDAPEALMERSSIETVAAYRQGDTTLPNWWVARDSDGESAGVVLLASIFGLGVELAYLGVVPKKREIGLGQLLVEVAFWKAKQLGSQVLTVTVDERNSPAMKIYQRKGFTLYQSQRLYLWKSSWST